MSLSTSGIHPCHHYAQRLPFVLSKAPLLGPKCPVFEDRVVATMLSFMCDATWRDLTYLSKSWYQAVKGKAYMLRLPQAERFTGTQGEYAVMHTITRQDAEAILKQTGYEVPMPLGQEQIVNFTIGEGSFGKFCVGSQKAHFVGIKITLGKDASMKEVMIQKTLSHLPSIMPALDSCQQLDPSGTPALYQVMELAGLGSVSKLKTYLEGVTDPHFKEEVLFCVAEGLLIGLTNMHESGIAHLDVKPDNLVIHQDGRILIIDFGCSEKFDTTHMNMDHTMGDLSHFSPERVRSLVESLVCDPTKIDAWAAGLTLLSLADPKLDFNEEFFSQMDIILDSGEAPEQQSKAIDACAHNMLAQVQVNHLQVFDKDEPAKDSFWSLVRGLLTLDPKKRLSPAEAQSHPWFVIMQKSSALWRKETLTYLREFVQTMQREKIVQERVKKASPVYSALSPQDLPLAHFATFIPRPKIQEALEKELFAPTNYATAPITVCQGMGGTGKTQMVTHLVHTQRVQNHFGLKFWLRSSDNKKLLLDQLYILARELGLVDEKAKIEEALSRLHYYLKHYLKNYGKPWLAIFDNADDPDSLKDLLPQSGGNIIITTRSVKWEKALLIDVLREDEGQTLVCKLLRSDDPHSRDLCQELGYLPLGIVQACAFIRNQQVAIPAYLEQLRKSASLLEKNEALFGKQLPGSILSLWHTTFATVRGLSAEAFELLEVIALLAPDNLPSKLLLALAPPSAQEVLKRYALIQESGKDMCSIHRLVQLALRTQQETAKQINVLAQGMETLKKIYREESGLQAEKDNSQLLAHGEALLEHYERLATPKQVEGLWAETVYWIDNIHSERIPAPQRKERLENALVAAKQTYGENHPAVAKLLDNLGNAWCDLGDYKKAIQYYEQALAIFRKAFGDEHPWVATSLNNLGINWIYLGDAKKAIQYFEQALAIRRKAYGEGHPSIATSLSSLASAWRDLGDAKKALQYDEEALTIRKKAYGADHPKLTASFLGVGNSWGSLGNSKKAIQYYEQALAIRRKTFGEEHPNLVECLNNLGHVWRDLGDAKKSIPYLEQALAIERKFYGEEHPDVAMCLNSLGLAWNDLGDAKKAIQYFEQALAIERKVFGEEHPTVALYLSNLGKPWDDLGEPKKAIQYYEQALAIYKKVYGEEHPEVARSLSNLGVSWSHLGDAMKSIQHYEQALVIRKKIYGEEHPDVALTFNNMGQSWSEFGESEKAIKYFDQALDIYQKAYSEEHPNLAVVLNNLGMAWKDLGKTEKAIQCYERALVIIRKAYGGEHPEEAKYLSNLGSAWISNDQKKAIQYYEQALAILKKAYGEKHPNVATALNNLGYAWKDLGEVTKAIEYLEQALDIYRKAYGEEHPLVATSLGNLGNAWSNLGDTTKAIQYLEQALIIKKKVFGEEHSDIVTALMNLGLPWVKSGLFEIATQYLTEAYLLALKLPSLGKDHPNTKLIEQVIQNLPKT